MKPQVISIQNIEEAQELMNSIGVSPAGIEIMAPKMVQRILYIQGVDHRAANILKQEMLARGGEAAVPYDVLNISAGMFEVVLIGTLKHFEELCVKLEIQPFGLKKLANEIRVVLEDYEKPLPVLKIGNNSFDFQRRTHIMGVLNITPDSFSDGGKFFDHETAIKHAIQLVADGADIIDIGGESTRPGANSISLDEELRRTIPVIEALVDKVGVPISIDTYKPEVAKRAIDAGALMLNDINGLRDSMMADLIIERQLPTIIMHMKGTPKNMQDAPSYKNVVREVISWLGEQANAVIEAGLSKGNILIDPGIGFGKTFEHNLELLAHMSDFRSLGYPIVIGTSRKAFLGAILDSSADERLEGSIATAVQAALHGANIIRVHDVKQVTRALKVADAISRRKVSE